MDRALSGREREREREGGRALQRRVLQRRAHYSFAPLLSFPLSLFPSSFFFFLPQPSSCLPEIKRRTSWTDVGPASAIQTLSLVSVTLIVDLRPVLPRVVCPLPRGNTSAEQYAPGGTISRELIVLALGYNAASVTNITQEIFYQRDITSRRSTTLRTRIQRRQRRGKMLEREEGNWTCARRAGDAT